MADALSHLMSKGLDRQLFRCFEVGDDAIPCIIYNTWMPETVFSSQRQIAMGFSMSKILSTALNRIAVESEL